MSSKNNIQNYANAGTQSGKIDVKISHKIIELFSEGLYSSPSKAIEELVANSFDAGASKTHVLVSTDLVKDGATITVIDDGIGMDEDGLRQHWVIGESSKRKQQYSPPKGRLQIGKFGIGKLATYVLGHATAILLRSQVNSSVRVSTIAKSVHQAQKTPSKSRFAN